ncbi:MAG: SHOCT domain-containing protein [Cyanobacteria bacterium P01_D01_bin.36]
MTPANTLAKNRKIAIALAFAGSLPSPLPLTWLHKFYLGEYLWGIAYLVLAPTMLPSMACCLEGVWYLTQSDEGFAGRFPKAGSLLSSVSLSPDDSADTNSNGESAKNTKAQAAQQVAAAMRELDQLRQDGLITEYEFEQKRRNLLAEID